MSDKDAAHAVVEIIDRHLAKLAGSTDRDPCDARRALQNLRLNMLRPESEALLPVDLREPRFLN